MKRVGRLLGCVVAGAMLAGGCRGPEAPPQRPEVPPPDDAPAPEPAPAPDPLDDLPPDEIDDALDPDPTEAPPVDQP